MDLDQDATPGLHGGFGKAKARFLTPNLRKLQDDPAGLVGKKQRLAFLGQPIPRGSKKVTKTRCVVGAAISC
eukprot:3901773-Prorocentrum_lima.AAC.1